MVKARISPIVRRILNSDDKIAITALMNKGELKIDDVNYVVKSREQHIREMEKKY